MKMLIPISKENLKFQVDQLTTICEFFEHRDEMNAHVHMDTMRRSPITIAAWELREELATALVLGEEVDNEADQQRGATEARGPSPTDRPVRYR